MQITLYSILQVTEDADIEIIEASYKALSKKYHPDNQSSGDATLFTQIANAYEILSNQKRRCEYDQRRKISNSAAIGVNSAFIEPKAVVTIKRLDGTDTWCTIDEHIKRKGMELESTCLDNLILRNIQLPSANLSHSRFNGVIFENVCFTGANLANISAAKAIFKGVRFEQADLTSSQFTDCDFRGSLFSKMKLINCQFVRCLFDEVSFAALLNSDNHFFTDQDLASMCNCRFISCSMQSVKLGDITSGVGCLIHNIDFSGSNLTNAIFCNSKIMQCSFNQTILLGADFHKAVLKMLDLSTCNLINARFHESNLCSVKLPEGFSLPVSTKINESSSVLTDQLCLKLGDSQQLNLIWCPPGRFLMGSPKTEKGRDSDESQHWVTFTKGFWIGKYPVTQGQWETIMKTNPSHYKKHKFWGIWGGKTQPNHPVESISLGDCASFIKRITSLFPKFSFSLPTEAQWEYACRAGTTTAYYFGDNESDLKDFAWFFDNLKSGTMEVGMKKPNPIGLYDMLGNVRELCADGYAAYPDSDVIDQILDKGDQVSVRGGCFVNGPTACRCAYRGNCSRGFEYNSSVGFRIVAIPC